MSSSCVSNSSGGGTAGMVNWCCNGLSWVSWKETWQVKMGCPCWMAFTERTEKLFPVRVRSTWYSTGTLGSPETEKGGSAVGPPHKCWGRAAALTAPPTPSVLGRTWDGGTCRSPGNPSDVAFTTPTHGAPRPPPSPALPAVSPPRSPRPGRTCPHEVAVQRVHLLGPAHGAGGRHQRLPHDLPAEQPLRRGHPVVPAPAGRRRR